MNAVLVLIGVLILVVVKNRFLNITEDCACDWHVKRFVILRLTLNAYPEVLFG